MCSFPLRLHITADTDSVDKAHVCAKHSYERVEPPLVFSIKALTPTADTDLLTR